MDSLFFNKKYGKKLSCPSSLGIPGKRSTPRHHTHTHTHTHSGLGGSDVPSEWRPGDHGFNPCRGQQHSFVEIDHEMFSTLILSLPLIQVGQLSVSGERMCTILVNRLED